LLAAVRCGQEAWDLGPAREEPAARMHIRPWGCSQLVSWEEWGTKYIKKKNIKPTELMSQMIRYRSRSKGVSIKLGNPMARTTAWILIRNHIVDCWCN
jgi:hypothetical protein